MNKSVMTVLMRAARRVEGNHSWRHYLAMAAPANGVPTRALGWWPRRREYRIFVAHSGRRRRELAANERAKRTVTSSRARIYSHLEKPAENTTFSMAPRLFRVNFVLKEGFQTEIQLTKYFIATVQKNVWKDLIWKVSGYGAPLDIDKRCLRLIA